VQPRAVWLFFPFATPRRDRARWFSVVDDDHRFSKVRYSYSANPQREEEKYNIHLHLFSLRRRSETAIVLFSNRVVRDEEGLEYASLSLFLSDRNADVVIVDRQEFSLSRIRFCYVPRTVTMRRPLYRCS